MPAAWVEVVCRQHHQRPAVLGGQLQRVRVRRVAPDALHPLGGDWTETLRQTREGTSRFRDVNTVFLGWAGLALAIVGVVLIVGTVLVLARSLRGAGR